MNILQAIENFLKDHVEPDAVKFGHLLKGAAVAIEAEVKKGFDAIESRVKTLESKTANNTADIHAQRTLLYQHIDPKNPLATPAATPNPTPAPSPSPTTSPSGQSGSASSTSATGK